MSLFKNAKQRYTVDFPPVYGILNENKILRVQQNQEGDTNIPFTVGIPLSGKIYDVAFHFVLILEDLCFFLVVAKNPEQHTSTYLSKSTHALHYIHGQVTQSARDRLQQRAATKARSHQTDDRRFTRSYLAAPAAAPPPLLRDAATAVGPVCCCCCK